MKFTRNLFALFALFVMPVMLYVAACGSKTPEYSYAGPGSKWGVTLKEDGTFTITHAPDTQSDIDMTVNGTYTRLSTGFVKLVVTSATGTNAPDAGEEAYGLEIPGFAFMLKPVGDDTNVIPMVASGSCPTSDLAANWIILEKSNTSNATNSSQDWYGTFTHTVSTNTSNVATKYSLVNTTDLGSTALTGTTCEAGIMHLESDNVDMFLTSGNGAIVHTNIGNPTDDSFIVAFPSETISSATALDGSYAGIVFDKSASSGSENRIFPMNVTFTASSATAASAVGTKLTNVETGETDTGSATISLTSFNSPSAGFARGTITADSATGNVVCNVNTNVQSTGKKVLFCIAQSPGNNTKFFNFLAVSK
jgi:hypothetical protein